MKLQQLLLGVNTMDKEKYRFDNQFERVFVLIDGHYHYYCTYYQADINYHMSDEMKTSKCDDLQELNDYNENDDETGMKITL